MTIDACGLIVCASSLDTVYKSIAKALTGSKGKQARFDAVLQCNCTVSQIKCVLSGKMEQEKGVQF